MQAVSIHVVDVANGLVARGMKVEVYCLTGGTDRRVVTGTVGGNGVVDGFDSRETLFDVGTYELRLHVGDYYRQRGTPLPQPAFMDVQVFRFGLADLSAHYHLPVKLTPWGLSCFRGA